MDYSTKVKTTTTATATAAGTAVTEQPEIRPNHRHSSETATDAASSPLTSDHQDTTAYPCPACPIVVTTSRDLTNHLRGHNSPRSTDYSGEDDYSCGVCHKVLSSASSLDRHVLVHSGERPFKCKHCDMAFTTNGNMNRHLRTAHHVASPRDNSAYTDSEGSSDSEKSGTKRRHDASIEQEYNNNEIGKSPPADNLFGHRESYSPTRFTAKRKRSDITDDPDNTTRKHKIMLGNSRAEYQNGDASNDSRTAVHNCPVCGRLDFATSALLEAHLERHHPEFPAKCDPCNLSFKNHRVLNLHKYMKHIDGEMGSVGNGPVGNGSVGNGSVGNGSVGNGPVGNGSVGNGSVGNGSVGNNGRNLRNSVVGFNDLTFVDFSSGKFPAIARAVCEQSLHRPASGEIARFQCDKCLRAFPCRSALDAHEIDCGTSIRASSACCLDERSSRRDDFFAGLDLQNRAALTEAKDGKDLADIQSIISLTSGPILQSFPRSDASTPEHHRIKANASTAGCSSGSSSTPSSSDYHQEEEAQDAFAAEFRRMKLKGEFPCRLCEAVFPNLRALKGHNRSHMGVGPGMPYPCNMCPYTSNDKGTLVRHLRSHNGDRPFECSLCNFAFTTKANCERHVRNRHGKVSRDEIKSVIIYHPSEDSTNDSGSLDRADTRREDARKSLVYPTSAAIGDKDDSSQRREDFYLGLRFGNKQSTPSSLITDEPSHSLRSPRYDKTDAYPGTPRRGLYTRDTSHGALYDEDDEDDYDDYDCEDNENDCPIGKPENAGNIGYESRSSEEDGAPVSDAKMAIHQRVQASPIDLKKQSTGAVAASAVSPNVDDALVEASTFGIGEDAPLDLSMDVLDLSKKSNVNGANRDVSSSSSPVASGIAANETEYGRNQKDFYDATNQYLLTQALLKAGQAGNTATSLEALYANAHMIYRNFGGLSAAGVGTGILPPYLFNPHMFGQDFAIKDRLRKELLRGLQLTSGGNLVEPSVGNTAFTGAYPPAREATIPRAEQPNDYPKLASSKLTPKIPTGTSSIREPKLTSPQSSNSVKMVIKNGVLMPKQKQRRYRTERPFTCEHCSARFTLRSNMERHIKQQHPQHWSQRPRGGHSTRGRPPANPASLVAPIGNNHQVGRSLSQACNPTLPKIATSPGASSSYEKHAISDQVKYAILAQQLKGSKIEENDTEEELVIDESAAHESKEADAEALARTTTSLLRGKLEGTSTPYRETRSDQLRNKAPEAARRESPGREEATTRTERTNVEPLAEDCRNVVVKTEPEEADDREEKVVGDGDRSEAREPSESGLSETTKVEQSTSRDCPTIERSEDLASVSELLDNASQQYQQFQPQYMSDEEGLVASTSDCNNSGSDEKSDSVNSANSTNSQTSSKRKKKKKKKMKKKKSAYSMAPNRVICPYCERPFPWTSSLRRHILTHTGQKPYQCMHCSLLFTTKSNCDRHLLRKHKNNANKIRRMRNSSSPETLEQPSNNNDTSSNNNNISSSNNNNNNNNSSSSAFAMRNVPERPYKCNLCPSSTFSTLGNLKKHKSSKHSRNPGVKSRAESPVESEPRNSPITTSNKRNDNSGYESQSSGVSENTDHTDALENLENLENTPTNVEGEAADAEIIENRQTSTGPMENRTRDHFESTECNEPLDNSTDNATPKNHEACPTMTTEAAKSRRLSPRSSPGPTDAPFKCHLCDSGFSERQDCLEHIRINHTRSYEVLVAKGALDMDIETPEEQQNPNPSAVHTSDGEEKRGRFPDYSNRKVVCAFCMRRFWSAEDLRRHMRTHTGERPFSCDICCRRFTLKHSMLRHRKKHESVDSMMYVGTSGDEESAPSQPPTITPRGQQQHQHNPGLVGNASCDSGLQERMSIGSGVAVATGDAAPSGLGRFNPYEKLATFTGKMTNAQPNFNIGEATADTENDLISNLLGIRDKSIIDKVLQASADDAAKLLGVNRHHD